MFMLMPLGSGEYPATGAKVRGLVLVVDGESLVRWALAASLSTAGYDVVTAANGADACAIAAKSPHPAVVLLDLRPDTHGQTFLDQIKLAAPSCRVLVLTTERRDGVPPGWLGAEAIEKPFDLAEVVRLVGEAVAAE